jgi:DNA-binding LacI/PurR family transcriptional regulator
MPTITPPLPERISLVSQTARALREGIRAGHWTAHLPGERTLCTQLQVGRNTLRAALAELQREGWVDVAVGRRRAILSQRRRRASNRMRKDVLFLLPISTEEMGLGSLMEVGRVREMLANAGHNVHLQISKRCFSERPSQAAAELMRRYPGATWLVCGSKTPLQRWLLRHRVPSYIMGSSDPALGLPSIDCDHEAIGRHAVGIFLRKGHSRLALIMPEDAYGGDLATEKGFLNAIHQAANGASGQILRHNGGKAHLRDLLDASLQCAEPPTAYLVSHTHAVITVMSHLRQRGKTIPDDLAVISRDHDLYLNCYVPAISHYVFDFDALARRTVRAVRQWLEHGKAPNGAIRLIPDFVKGETV